MLNWALRLSNAPPITAYFGPEYEIKITQLDLKNALHEKKRFSGNWVCERPVAVTNHVDMNAHGQPPQTKNVV